MTNEVNMLDGDKEFREWLYSREENMTDREDTLNDFLQKVDAVNDFCDARVNNRGEENACKDCVLNDYCLNIPSRESYKAAFMSVDKCMELIRRAKEEEKDDSRRENSQD